ncbi:MAG TPA: gluconate 2-dehydrogenase subunit 3 family protein [Solirubrobacterales bacterium]|nr:gluconate 2-dehydrogenase subunit 3 family protein [Solirubrobacterales bacterium]
MPNPIPDSTKGLFPPEAAEDLAAICERILPGGDGRPSASQAGVPEYVEGQLAGPWGQGARMYRQGPFEEPADEGHGWQSPMTPAEVYRSGLAALDRYTAGRFGKRFAELPEDAQDEVVGAWADGKVDSFEDVDGKAFFAMVRKNVAEGLFSDPLYGGNREMVGWRWLGYPGVAAAHGGEYAERVERYEEPYSPEPRSLSWRESE